MIYNNTEDIVAVIVLYNMALEESSTFITLTASLECIGATLDLFVYDNSPYAQEPDASKYASWIISYTHDINNPGVSTAYNRACEYAAGLGKKWLLLLDQDTVFPVESFKHYLRAISCSAVPLVVPRLISSSGRLASPARYLLHRGSHIGADDLRPGENNLYRRSFLNSGSLIALDAFELVGGFDVDLFYYSDHDFFFRLNKFYFSYFLLDLNVTHDVSSSEVGIERFELLLMAMTHMARKYKTIWPYIWLYTRVLKITLISRKLHYLCRTIGTVRGRLNG